MAPLLYMELDVPLSYYTVADFDRFGAALSSTVKEVRVKDGKHCICRPIFYLLTKDKFVQSVPDHLQRM